MQEEIKVICSYEIFSTGVDVREEILMLFFIARPVNSPVLFNQMVGRGTRTRERLGGGDSFTLVQVIDKIIF